MFGMRRREFITLLGGAAARGRSRRGRSNLGSCRWSALSPVDRSMAPLAMPPRSAKASANPATLRAKT